MTTPDPEKPLSVILQIPGPVRPLCAPPLPAPPLCASAAGPRAFRRPRAAPSPQPAQRDYTINGETRPSSYAGKTFEVAVNLHADHPVTGPEERDIRFLKVPLHPNIRPDGVTCGELPKWDAKMRLMDIARNIRRILSQPNTEAFASVAARNLIRRGVEAFEEAAKADPAEPVEDEPAAEGADAAAAGGAAGGGAA